MGYLLWPCGTVPYHGVRYTVEPPITALREADNLYSEQMLCYGMKLLFNNMQL